MDKPKKKLYIHFMLRGLRPQATHAFGLNPPNQLVIGYHWLALLNQVRKNLSPRNLVSSWRRRRSSYLKSCLTYV